MASTVMVVRASAASCLSASCVVLTVVDVVVSVVVVVVVEGVTAGVVIGILSGVVTSATRIGFLIGLGLVSSSSIPSGSLGIRDSHSWLPPLSMNQGGSGRRVEGADLGVQA